jgi:hypothetical protein
VPLVKAGDILEDVDEVPLVNPDYYIRLFINIGGITPNINPAAPKLSGKSYDCTTKKWTQTEPSKYGLSIPDFTVLGRDLRSGASETGMYVYRSPIFNEKELLNYLRKPAGGKTFSFEVKDYSKNNTEEVSTTILVNVELR